MATARCPQIPLDEEADAACAVLFIGGLGDWLTGRQLQTMRRLPPLLPCVAERRAYYHWDGGGLGLLRDDCLRIRDDLAAWRARRPHAPVVLCGHSYGGSAAMHIVRHLPAQPGPIVLVTIDAVSRRQNRERAGRLEKWYNVYLKETYTLADIVPRIGGRWGHCPDADVNLPIGGRQRDKAGRPFSHPRALPFLTDAPCPGADNIHALVASTLVSLLKIAHPAVR